MRFRNSLLTICRGYVSVERDARRFSRSARIIIRRYPLGEIPAGGEMTEDSPLSQTFVLKHRIRSERHALGLSEDGVRVSAIRLPPYVYGRGGSYFAPMLMEMAAKAGEPVY